MTKNICFALCIAATLLLLYPQVDFQPYLAQGDHGRDLYAFAQTHEGDIAYRDYWWVYGPLLPYYYALFFKLYGINIMTVLVAESFLTILSVALFFLILALFISPWTALLGALWFLLFKQDFFFTYNHTGGITLTLAVIYTAALYLLIRHIKYAYFGLLAVFLLCLVKINFGLTALATLLLCVGLTDRLYGFPLTKQKKKFYLLAVVALPVVVAGIYLYYLSGISIYELRQCLPYLAEDHPHRASVLASVKSYLTAIGKFMSSHWTLLLFSAMVSACAVIFIRKATRQRNEISTRVAITLLSLLALYYILNMHEFLVSGVHYRKIWAQPIGFLMTFLIVGYVLKKAHISFRIVGYAIIGLTVAIQAAAVNKAVAQFKIPQRYISHPRGKVFTGNHPTWIATVLQATRFLESQLGPEEAFLALPYDPIYYYLTDRKSPTRQLIFFDHINIPPEQELKIIDELESADVRWVLISSRADSQERGLGTFGDSYCPLLANYIKENFVLAKEFGDWENHPGWNTAHGTRIYRRKDIN